MITFNPVPGFLSSCHLLSFKRANGDGKGGEKKEDDRATGWVEERRERVALEREGEREKERASEGSARGAAEERKSRPH